MVDKVTYRFSTPQPGDVIVFKLLRRTGTSATSRSGPTNTAVRFVQNALSFVEPPADENDLAKRVIAVGGQTVECRMNTGLTVDGKLCASTSRF